MAELKIGYPTGLSGVSTEDDGKALYNPFYTNSISLATVIPLWDYFVVDTVSYVAPNTEVNVSGTPWAPNQFQNGVLIQKSIQSANIGRGWKVVSNDTDTIVISGDQTPYISAGNYMYVSNGASAINFETDLSQLNPTRIEIKRGFLNNEFEMYFGKPGIEIPMGKKAELITFVAIIRPTDTQTSQEVMDILNTQFMKKLNFKGLDSEVFKGKVAPQVLEMNGTQTLVSIEGIQPIKEPKSLGGHLELKVQCKSFYSK